ncbi:hypothetical protein ACFVW2_07775 [Streptomyces sp. NPDC058171]
MGTEPDERSWAEAMDMYARRLTIAKVTSREHEDWALDAYTLMHGDTHDPRGWRTNDPMAEEFERLDDPFHPFVTLPDEPATTEVWKSHVHEIPRSSAERFLVALSTPWINVEKERAFSDRRGELEGKARVILSRFPDGSHFYANTGGRSASLDYYRRLSGWYSFSSYEWDFGLFLVSDTEVGMVWSFR